MVVPIRNVQHDQVQVTSTDKTVRLKFIIEVEIYLRLLQLRVEIKVPASNIEYDLQLNLAYPVNSARTDFKVNTANVRAHHTFLLLINAFPNQ